MSNVLNLSNVIKNYPDFTLDNVSFSVPKGCICGFIGQNGAGKTTTIQLILDIIKKDGGTIEVMGQSMEENGVALKEEIGVVYDFQIVIAFPIIVTNSLSSYSVPLTISVS